MQDLLHSIAKLVDQEEVGSVQEMQEQLLSEFILFKARNNIDQ